MGKSKTKMKIFLLLIILCACNDPGPMVENPCGDYDAGDAGIQENLVRKWKACARARESFQGE